MYKRQLLKRYLLSADGFKKRFRSAKPELGETPAQFLTRLDNYMERWIELAKITKSYEGLKTLIVQEQYLSTCPKEMAMHPKERRLETLTELGDVAETWCSGCVHHSTCRADQSGSSNRESRKGHQRFDANPHSSV